MECEVCKEIKPDVTIRLDPFAWEVNGEEWHVFMCDSCEQNSADDS